MPEGDTVWRTAQRLHAALAGRPAGLVDLRWGEVDEAPLTGAVVDEVVPRGKHLLHRFGSGWTLHTHLRMEGSWRVEAAGSEAARRALRRTDLRAAIDRSGIVTPIRTSRCSPISARSAMWRRRSKLRFAPLEIATRVPVPPSCRAAFIRSSSARSRGRACSTCP